MPIIHQDDIAFHCPSCQGRLVAEAKCAGISLSCPHCLKWIQVPFPEGYDFEVERPAGSANEAVKSVLENELEATRQKLRKSRADVTSLESEIKNVRAQADPLRAALEAANKRLTETREEVATLNTALAAAITARDDAETGRVIAERAANDRAQIQTDLDGVRIALAESAAESQRIVQGQQALQNELTKERERAGQFERDLDENQKRYKAVLAATHQEKDALAQQLATVQAELEQQRQSPAQAALERATARVSDLEAKLGTLQNERTGLISVRNDQSQIIEQLYEERATHAREHEQAEDLRYTLESHISSLEANLEGLNSALAASQEGRKQNAQQLAAEAEAHQLTRQELDRMQTTHRSHLDQHTALRTSFSKAETHLDEIRKTLTESEPSPSAQ